MTEVSSTAKRLLHLFSWIESQDERSLIKAMNLTSEEIESATQELLAAGLINMNGAKQ